MKILLTGGGTAGHVWPVVLVAELLSKNKRNRILFVGSGGIEKEIVKKENLPFKKVAAGKRRAYFSVLNFLDIFKTLFGIIQAFFIFIGFRPEVIFAKGGYVTVPIIFWAKLFHTPLVIHESDSAMGRTNLWASKYAKKICLGFPVSHYQNLGVDLRKLIYTGTPVAAEYFQTPIKTGDRKKLLITGGSQGSARINKIISDILPELLKKYEVWHLAGEKDFSDLGKITDPNYHVMSFTYEMAKIVRDADLIISRAGASTLAEISAAKKASILIPLPEAASNHQEKNAKVYSDINGALVLKEEKITPSSLVSIIDDLMEDDKMRELLGHHANSLAKSNSASEIVDVLFEVANVGK